MERRERAQEAFSPCKNQVNTHVKSRREFQSKEKEREMDWGRYQTHTPYRRARTFRWWNFYRGTAPNRLGERTAPEVLSSKFFIISFQVWFTFFSSDIWWHDLLCGPSLGQHCCLVASVFPLSTSLFHLISWKKKKKLVFLSFWKTRQQISTSLHHPTPVADISVFNVFLPSTAADRLLYFNSAVLHLKKDKTTSNPLTDILFLSRGVSVKWQKEKHRRWWTGMKRKGICESRTTA